MPPRANSTTSSSIGPSMSCQYSRPEPHDRPVELASISVGSASSSTQKRDRADHRPEHRAHAAQHHHHDEVARARPGMIDGLTKSVWLASSTPASPHITPAMTKQASL